MDRDTKRFLKLEWSKPAIRVSRNTLDRLISLYDGSVGQKMRETNISILLDGGNWTAKKPRRIVKIRLPRGGEAKKRAGRKE